MAFITLQINSVEDAIQAKVMLEAYIQMELALSDNNSKVGKMLSTKVKLDSKVVEPKVTIKEKETTKKEDIKPKVEKVEDDNSNDKVNVVDNTNTTTTNNNDNNITFADIQNKAKGLVKLADDSEVQRKIRYWIAKINIEIAGNKTAKIRNLDEKYYQSVYKAMENLENFVINKKLADVTIDKLKENL